MDDDRIVTPYEGRPALAWDPDRPVPTPLNLHSCTVARAWVDYNDHLSESSYLLVFGDSADAFFRWFGIDEAYRASGHSLFTAETHLRHLGQARLHDPLRLDLWVLGVDAKRVHVFHEMVHAETGRLLATAEQLLLHVDTGAERVVALPEQLLGRLQRTRAAHAAASPPGLTKGARLWTWA